MQTSEPCGWHSRGYLPHFDGGGEYAQFVTFRLADSLPHDQLVAWEQELMRRDDQERGVELRKRIEAFLDAGYGECYLRHEAVARIVENSLLHFDAVRYALHAWVVMPNHVHALFTPGTGRTLASIVGGWKSYTAKVINGMPDRTGRLWLEDYFDRYIRDERHYLDTANYIEQNPVAAGLCRRAEEWPFGSAHRRLDRTAAIPAASLPATGN